jgi:hypothetical protein
LVQLSISAANPGVAPTLGGVDAPVRNWLDGITLGA